MHEPRQRQVTVNGVSLCYFEWGERSDLRGDLRGNLRKNGVAPTLLVHATGFHSRCWDACAAALLAQDPNAHIVAPDMRGHGRSDKTPPFSWDDFGRDVVAFVEALDLREIVAAGHSMGGHCLVQAAAQLPERFSRLVLVDPVIMAPEIYASRVNVNGIAQAADHPTAKRRNHWHNAAEMFARFKDRLPFANWQPQVLRDYCEWGLLPDPSGTGFVLACPPQVEAAIYMGNTSSDVYSIIESVKIPVTVMRGRERDGERQGMMDFSGSPTWPGLAARFARGKDVYLPQLSHFIAMEDPELVATCILDRA